ncbi:MAG: hypothetical protein WC807_03980 [Hyphomicrobium sp.]|jgi:hypothetical protein
MDAKEAVAAAKAYFEEVFSEKPTLEEIWFDSTEDVWCVTLGRRRMLEEKTTSFIDIYKGTPLREITDYKVVRLSNKDGQIKSVRLREDGERAA